MSTRVSPWRTRQTYDFIEAHRREYDFELMCRTLDVARSGYYSRFKKPLSDRAREDTRLLKLNGAWLRARPRAGLSQVRVHDLKHTFGRRLRAAGVSFEDRQDLLGHRSGRITTHYSGAELSKLIESANRVCGRGTNGRPELVVRRRSAS